MASSMMKAAQYENGGPEKLTCGDAPIPTLRARDILIKVFASAINRGDTYQRQGKYPPPPGESDILGLEAAGIVEKLGPDASRWTIGERVMALLPGGGIAEYVSVNEDHVMSIPDKMTFNSASAIPEAWLAAYQLLHFVGNLKSSDTVLIHAGGSGVGTAAVQLVKIAGATSYVTAGSQTKIDVAKSLGAIEGFNYIKGTFAKKIIKATGGKGVDMVLDCVGAKFCESNLQVLAKEGRWVLFGALGGQAHVNGNILGEILRKRISLIGTTLRARDSEYKKKLVDSFAENVLPQFSQGKLKPIIETTFLLDNISEAHQMMEANKNTGKIIIEVNKDNTDKSEL